MAWQQVKTHGFRHFLTIIRAEEYVDRRAHALAKGVAGAEFGGTVRL
jgi:hypothetical protein